MFWGNEERHRLLLEKMEAIEIWGHIKGHGDIRQERNNFWYGHPVYFINHLERAGLLRHPRIDELLAVQDEVMALECLIQGHDGIYGIGKTGETFCNHAAYVTIRAVDANFRNFTNRKGTAFPEYTNSDENILEDNAPSSYNYRLSNYWCHVLEQQALRSNLSGIVEVNAKEAQEYANNGYVVIGALADLSGPDKHPHFVTVRPNPGNQYDPLGGPVVAHVGSSPNEERTAQGAYGNGEEWKNVHWYYNQRQEFIFDLSYINELKRRK
jgi:hypothetical protein